MKKQSEPTCGMIAAIYARKSTDHIFTDDGISGAECAALPGFLRLMNALKPRPSFQVLVMSEESRLGCEAIETAYALKQIGTAGVRVFFYLEDRERTLDSPTDKIMLSLTTFADELERERARQRTYDAMHRKARAGHVTGGRVFGYGKLHRAEFKRLTRLASVRYGKNVMSQWGWASEGPKDEIRSFNYVDRKVSLEHWRPNTKRPAIRCMPTLRAFCRGWECIDIGPCCSVRLNYGLAAPGQDTAISLAMASSALGSLEPTIDDLIALKVLSLLERETGDEFLKTQRQIEREEGKKIRRGARSRAGRRRRRG